MASNFQSRLDQNNFRFIVNGPGYIRDNQTLLTDGSRTVPLAQYTLMAQVAASGKWVPWISVSGTDGTAQPLGILMNQGGVAAASLAAADVTGSFILVAEALFDVSLLVFDKGSTGIGTPLTLATVINSGAIGATTADAVLRGIGLIPNTTVIVDNLEN